MKPIIRFVLFFTLGLLVDEQVLGGGPPGFPGGGGGGPPCWPAPCVPIDEGISLLLAAGLLYGGKRAYQIVKDKRRESVKNAVANSSNPT